ncbi:hypothetical protein VOLCADRAFT_106791 [Volvox carteri f. nagariensis]|uniref:Cilia- and flagella-associated protein 36 n=1 Tax=Volvox carteri f. nagariensis TaxID=3068 RepID=D8U9S7_VOLCA|nr:uncharacterized protein VOLCADRAFT_106791 [Volvox carteri f. nagariensis]EFJ43463.1 hypothetical protein VOLCADRAFT_106791 [Volvox carteri f. nagariensis]|eukprot:XP_002955392.1 hypothetical protein VOLCADRAFT_106791 [Volvox carteri f. nagariensis]
MGENAGKLEFVPLEEEQPLQNFDIFKLYATLVERQLEDFILSEGLTVKDVCDACTTAQNAESHTHLAAIDYLVASTDYESFMQLAYDHYVVANFGSDMEDEAVEQAAEAATAEVTADQQA